MKPDCQITRLPELTPENLDAVMAERIHATKNDKTIIPMLWQGLLEVPIQVNGRERHAKYYIPKDTPQGTAIVILNIPEGMHTLEFLTDSNWIAMADREGFCLFVLEPADGKWGSLTEEEPYLQAAVEVEKEGRHCMAAFASYIVGYGSIGVGLHKIAMADPLHVAAAVFMDAGDVDDACRNEYKQKSYHIPDLFNPKEQGLCVPYREIPIPVWIASEEINALTTAMIRYWRHAAKAEDIQKDSLFGTLYIQSAPTAYTPEGNILKIAVGKKKYDYCDRQTTIAIYSFLKEYYRYGMGPLSNMISRRPDFDALDVKHRRFTDSNGIDREYLVYMPKAFLETGKSLPTVIAYHGASQSMRNMMANGLWYKIADREGIIVVYPESTLMPMPADLNNGLAFAYRPLWSLEHPSIRHTELAYANELLDRVIDEFPVDESRIYCTGHSMGCMMTNYLGSSTVSHRFAAVAATSGCLKIAEGSGTQKVPSFMTIGQFDLWSYLVSDNSPVTEELNMWLIRNGLATDRNVSEIRATGASLVYQDKNYHHYVWKDTDGTPWVRYAWISGKHHVHTADENRIFWEEWFNKWRRDENGIRHYAEDAQVTKLPKLTKENLKDIMKERIAATKNDSTVIPMLWQGILEMEIRVKDVIRTAKLYIPKDTPQATPFILMNVPEGMDAIPFLQKSGWMDCADRKKMCLFAAEPGAGGWGTPDEELPYFSECLKALFDGIYFRGGMSAYVVGYGETGTSLHKTVLTSPLQIAAAVFWDAGNIDPAYLNKIETKSLDETGLICGVALGDIPVPVWIMEKEISAHVKDTCAHWARAIGADDPEQNSEYGLIYMQKKETILTPEGNIVQVCITETDADYCDPSVTEKMIRFLTGYSRYGKVSPFGNSLVRYVDYASAGVEVRRFADNTGNKRECLVYVPKAYQNREKLPLVFAIHGACESVRNYFEESLWYRKADEEGFIVVMPEASLEPVPDDLTNGVPKAYRSLWHLFHPDTRYSDLEYFDRIIEKVIEDYPVDEKRIYCTGHSMGCMMTNFIGSSPFGKRFAALAAASGVLKIWDSSGSQKIPIWLNMGQYDLWNYDIMDDTPLTNALDMWLIRNGLADNENVSQIRKSGATKKYTDGRHHGTIWENEQGIPLVRYEWIQKKDHMNTSDDTNRFWTQWFSKWSLDEQNRRCFEGRPI